MKKAIPFILSLFFLCSCDNAKEPEETDLPMRITETVMQSEADTQPVTAPTAAAKETASSDKYSITFTDENDSSRSITYTDEYELETLQSLTSAKSIYIEKCSDVSNIITPLKKAGDIGLERLTVITDNYSSLQAEELFKAFPAVIISYEQESCEWGSSTPEKGFVYYTEPLVSLTDEAAAREITCRFRNLTDSEGYINSLSVLYCENDQWQPAAFTNGETSLELNETVPAGDEYTYTLPDTLFDYQNAPAGRYKTVFELTSKEETQSAESSFFISTFQPHSPMTEEQAEFYPFNHFGEQYVKRQSKIYDSFADTPDFLSEEQLEAYNAALWSTWSFFSFDRYITEEYAASHSGSELLELFCKGFTKEYAEKKAINTYIDENGDLILSDGSRGSDITYGGMDFFPVYSDENEVIFRAEILHCHSDDPYFVWYESRNFHMVNTPEGWRFDIFEIWL